VNAIGVVLAGGRSSRMGTDKAELIFEGVTLVEHTFSILASSNLEAVYVNKNNSLRKNSAESTCSSEFNLIEDRFLNKGPLSGIHASLCQSLEKHEGRPVVFLPVDQPLISDQSIKSLVSEALDKQRSCYFDTQVDTKGQTKSNVLPLVIFDVQQALTAIEAIFNENKPLSLGFFLEHIQVSKIPHHKPHEFLNVNNPKDYQTLISRKN
jgi:molybdopterin-guanine dinucleotide biosynthesis protein A